MKSLGLDIGTSSICGTLMELDRGAQLEVVSVANDSALKTGHSWERVQDIGRIYLKCREIIDAFSEKWQDIACIGVTGQMHGIVYLDENGAAISPLYTWEDGRGDLPAAEGESYARQLSHITGHHMATGFGLTTHYYNLRNGLVPQEARCLCTAADYVALRLCGNKKPVMHVSNAASLGLFDLQTLAFDAFSIEKAGIPASFLPALVRHETLIGKSAEGVPVMVAIGDNQAGIRGSVDADEDIVLNIGTSSQISMITEDCVVSGDLECRPYVGGKYILLGAGLCGGSAFRLLNGFFREVCAFIGEVSRDEMDGLMMDCAKRAYGKVEPAHVTPLFRGTRSDPELRGVIENLNMDNFTPASLVLGFYKGVCEEMRRAYDKFPKSAAAGGRLQLCGNAARKNELLLKIIEDTFERSAYLSRYREEAAAGAALLAAAALASADTAPH